MFADKKYISSSGMGRNPFWPRGETHCFHCGGCLLLLAVVQLRFSQIDIPLLLFNVQVDELHFIGLPCQIGFDHRQDNRTVLWAAGDALIRVSQRCFHA